VKLNTRNKRAPLDPDRYPTAAEWRGLHRRGKPVKILADPELRAFVDEALSTMTLGQIAAASREKFGPKRGTSQSALQRYWHSVALPRLEAARPKNHPGPKSSRRV
jgi:hypothetical protein